MPNLLNIYKTGKTNIQLGNNSAKIDLLYVGNSAGAHILAAEALYKMHEETPHSERVDDEAFFVEWIFWLVFWGSKEPKLTRRKIKHTCMYRTFRIDKAKSRLGYVPEVSMEEGIERGVKRFLEAEAQDQSRKQL